MNPIDQALADLRAVPDPARRVRRADELDTALSAARGIVARIKRDAVNQLRSPTVGYGQLATRFGLSKARLQQIANTPNRIGLVAYAFRDAANVWHGEPDLLTAGAYHDRQTANAFDPADQDNPYAGQLLTVRCGDLADEENISAHGVHVVNDDGNAVAVRMTHRFIDQLFGPAHTGTPEHAAWEAARQARHRQRDG